MTLLPFAVVSCDTTPCPGVLMMMRFLFFSSRSSTFPPYGMFTLVLPFTLVLITKGLLTPLTI